MIVAAKRFAAVVAVALMGAVVLIPATASSSGAAVTGFRDVPGNHQFYKHITWMSQQNITTGYSEDDTFRPREKVSREAFAAYLYRLAGRPSVSLPGRSPFKDVPTSAQFYREIVWLSKQGITTGWSDGTFRPKEDIARDAMAAFLYRYEGKPSYRAPSRSPFKDVPTSAQFYKEIAWMADEGISTGWSDGTFRPYHGTSREATAAFLFRSYAPSGYSAPAYRKPAATYDADALIRAAAAEVGYREWGWRQNKYNSWIGANYAWCHVYIGYAMAESGNYGLVPTVPHFNTYVRELREAGVLDTNVSTSDLQRGDIVLVDWPPYNGPTHTGIVHRATSGGVWLYEGNTTDGTGDQSRGVFHRWRDIDYIYASFDPQEYYDATR